MALVAETAECVEAGSAHRAISFKRTSSKSLSMTQQLQRIIEPSLGQPCARSLPSLRPRKWWKPSNTRCSALNNGTLRVAIREGVGQWTVHQWLKKAVLLSFRLNDNRAHASR